MTAYLTDVVPPDELITSVRAVVEHDEKIAVLFNANGCHPLPGGRRLPDEPLLDALRREVDEETGCAIDEPRYLGFIHFEHLTPCPDGYAYPYPHFFQVIYGAAATAVRPTVDPDGWEERVEFIRREELPLDQFDDAQRLFVEASLVSREP